jgi:alpha-beta hydrolase superfamily lysophospholipase
MAMSESLAWTDHFPGNFLWSNAMLVCKGMAPYGAVSLQEIDRIGARLKTRQVEPEAWREEWCAMAAELERKADTAAAQARDATAGNYYLRAGNYYYTGERFIPPGEEKLAIGRRAYHCYHAGLKRRHPNIEFVEVPYEGGSLPALFMKSTVAVGPAPTVVIFNGMDNCKEMSVLFAGLEFAKRGMHTLAIDGPGQGETLRFRGIHARYDYEVPGTAAYEYVVSRADVLPGKVVVMGYSFGGYYAGRIAAFEKRFAAGVALTACHWDLAAWQLKIKERAQTEKTKVAQSNFQFQWVVNASDADAAIEIAKKFTLRDLAQRVTCPFLVTHGENDRVIPVENAAKLYEALGSSRKALKVFTADEGGAEHAHVDHRQVGIDFAADWIVETLGGPTGWHPQ